MYNSQKAENYDTMYPLIGGLIRDEKESVVHSQHTLFPFKIFFGNSLLHLYATKKEEKERWVQSIKEAIGYSDLKDYYDLQVTFWGSFYVGFQYRKRS